MFLVPSESFPTLLLEKQWNDSGFRHQTLTEYCTNKRQTLMESDGVSLYWAISYLICIITNIKKKSAMQEN